MEAPLSPTDADLRPLSVHAQQRFLSDGGRGRRAPGLEAQQQLAQQLGEALLLAAAQRALEQREIELANGALRSLDRGLAARSQRDEIAAPVRSIGAPRHETLCLELLQDFRHAARR